MPRKTARVAHFRATKHARRSRLGKAFNALKANVKKNTMLLKNTVEGKQIYIESSHELSNGFESSPTNLLDGLAQGVADTGTGATVSTGARIGNSINVQSLSVRMILDGQQKSATAQNPQAKSLGAVRCLIVDSPEGQAFSVSDILHDATTQERRIVSMYQTAQNITKKYKVLFDKTYTFTDASCMKPVMFYKKYANGGKKLNYDNNATSPNNYRPQLIMLTYNCDGNVNQFFLESKVKFLDM